MSNDPYFSDLNGSEYICHYGVKGMKWGVRKDRKESGNFSDRLAEKRYARARKAMDKYKRRSKKAWDSFKEMYKNHPKLVTAVSGAAVLGTIGLIAYNSDYDNVFRGFYSAVFKEPFK